MRVLIRKKRSANTLIEIFESNVINLNRPTKMVLEVANSESQAHDFILTMKYYFPNALFIFTGGNIRLYSENLKTTPIVSVFDETPLPIQYVSFASFETTENQFFYNCSHIDTSISKKP